jgi:LPS-assembly protein
MYRFFFLLSIVSIPALFGGADLPELSADQPIVLSQDGQSLVAQGNAELLQGDMLLQADSIRYSRDGGFGEADSNVRLGLPQMRIVTSKVTYDLENASLKTPSLQGVATPWCFESEGLVADGEQTILMQPNVFFGEPDPFAPNCFAQKATWVGPSRILVLDHAILRIGKLPFFYWPRLKLRRIDRPFDVSFKFGYSKKSGGYVKTELTLPLFEGVHPGVNFNYYAKRGILAGPIVKMDIVRPNWEASGKLVSGMIQDRGKRGVDIFKRPIPKKRDFLSWRQHVKAYDKLEAIAKVDILSDSFVTRDFAPERYTHNQEPDNFAEVTWNDDRYQLSLFTRFNPNDFESYTERLPELGFRWNPSRVGVTPVYHQFYANVAHLNRKATIALPKASGNRSLAYYGLFYPIRLTDWMTLTPVAGVQLAHYSDLTAAPSARSNYTRWLGQVGFDWQMQAHGLWEGSESTWKHTVIPMMQYRYIPNAQQGAAHIPHFDEAAFEPYVPMLDLAERRDIDHMDETHNLRFGLQNTFQKRTQQSIRTVAAVNFYQDLRFEPGPLQQDWSDFHTEILWWPVKAITLRLHNRLNPEGFSSQQTDLSLHIRSAKHWHAFFGATYLRPDTQQYWGGFSIALNEKHRLTLGLRYDAKLSQLVQQWYGYSFQLGKAWWMEPYLKRFQNASREKGWEIGLKVALVSF